MIKNNNPDDIYGPNPDDTYFCTEEQAQKYQQMISLQANWNNILASACTLAIHVANDFEKEFLALRNISMITELSTPDFCRPSGIARSHQIPLSHLPY